MPFFLLFVWTVISSIIFCQISFAQENLKMIQSTGRAAILEDISKDEARNLALEDALYYAALKGGAQIDGFSHVNSETALEDEFLVRPISKILDYRIIDEVIDDTHYQITIEAAIGEMNKNEGCQNRSISQITLFRPTLQISNNVPGWMSQLPLSISKKITVELSEKPEIRLRDARHTKLNTENFQRINTSLDYKSLTTGRINMRNGDFAISTDIKFEKDLEKHIFSNEEFLSVKIKSYIYYPENNIAPEIISDEYRLRLGSKSPIRTISIIGREKREKLLNMINNAASIHAKKIVENLICYPMLSTLTYKNGELFINIGKRQGLEKNLLAFTDGNNTPWTILKVQSVLENSSIMLPLDKNKNFEELNGKNIRFLEF